MAKAPFKVESEGGDSHASALCQGGVDDSGAPVVDPVTGQPVACGWAASDGDDQDKSVTALVKAHVGETGHTVVVSKSKETTYTGVAR